jgi:hypothetical protein
MSLLLPPQSVISLANIPLSSCVPISWQVLANRDPAGAVCKIDQICWPPSTTQTSAQGVTTMQIKKHIQYIAIICVFAVWTFSQPNLLCSRAVLFTASLFNHGPCEMPNGSKWDQGFPSYTRLIFAKPLTWICESGPTMGLHQAQLFTLAS